MVNSSSDYVSLAKPPTQASRRRAKRKIKNALIASVRVKVMNRDRQCRVCGSSYSLHMHEVVFRSKGLPLEQTFSLMNCLALCAECHHKVHARKIWLSFENQELGCNGQVVVTEERIS